MKKLFTFFAIFTLTAFTIHAQDDIIIGAKGGINGANVTGEGNPMKFVPHLGGYMQFMFNESFGIQPELLLSWQGHGRSTEFGFEQKLNTTYINVPLLFKYNITYNINLMAGPQVGFLASANSVFEDSATGETIKSDVSDFWNAVDVGLGVGGGFYFMDRFHAYLRYVISLATANLSDARNSVIQVGVGVNLVRIEQ